MARGNDAAYLRGLGNAIGFTKATFVLAQLYDQRSSNASPNCDGRGDVCGRTSNACLRTGQPRTLSNDRGNAALEGRGIRKPEAKEYHRDERVVAGPILTPFSCAYIAACNQSEITFSQIASGHEEAFPH